MRFDLTKLRNAGVAALIVICTAALSDVPKATYLGSFRWHMDTDWFGGFSGLELSSDGTSMTVISDRSKILTARIRREDSRIVAIIAEPPQHLKSSAGKRLVGRIADSEGLAIAPDGTIYVSFEGVHRVSSYASPGAVATPLQRPAWFNAMRFNGSLEALAIDRDGRLYTLPENKTDANGQIPIYRWDHGKWAIAFSLPARGKFRPVGADFGPDGKFYLLERTYGVFGFRSRLRRWDITEAAARNEQTLLETTSGTHDNLEGLSIWRDEIGRLRATMIADDNFMAFQSTELVEYSLTE